MGKDNKKTGGGKDKKSGGGGGGSSSSKDSSAKDDKLKPCTSINVRHILCAKHGQITVALERLAAGESFDKVARELSEDKARQGGSLGWQIRGAMVKEFEDGQAQLQYRACQDWVRVGVPTAACGRTDGGRGC
jgi:NIMA-interacting peptidyl-prolyl cis-trans isomerase 4